jgi:TRAP-type C4-dicarboxylate transport system permease small subunit
MIDRIVDRAAGAIVTLLGLVFIGAVCLNFANVVGRYAFGRAIFGADEVQTYIMVWMAFVGAAAVTWRNAHLRMDVLVTSLPAWLQAALRLVELALMIATAAFVLVQSWRYVGQMAAMDRRSDAAGMPMAVPHAAVAIGFGLILLIALWRLARFRAAAREGAARPPT